MSVDGEALRAALAATGRDHGPGVYGLVNRGRSAGIHRHRWCCRSGAARPIEAGDRYRIGSVTKMYVATLVWQMVADGMLGLDDAVEDRPPGLVPGGDRITVATLLRLRSGLPDYVTRLFGGSPDRSVHTGPLLVATAVGGRRAGRW